jgi:hypothetical protein
MPLQERWWKKRRKELLQEWTRLNNLKIPLLHHKWVGIWWWNHRLWSKIVMRVQILVTNFRSNKL